MTVPFASLALLQAAPGGGGGMMLVIQIALILGIFYFMMIRPQQQQRKKHEAALKGLKRGDDITTAGGIIGRVIHIKEETKDGAPVQAMDDAITIQSGESRLIVERGRIARIRLDVLRAAERVTPLPLRVLGDPILREETRPVAAITEDLRRLIDDMFETMYAARGIGLAAPQVGRGERVAIVDVDDEQLVLINPEIMEASSTIEKDEEGCLSIPDIYGDVERPESIRFRALDRDGNVYEREASGLLARCIQHEADHLHGKLFIDYLSFLKRRAVLAKWKKEQEKYPGNVRVLSAEEIAKHHHRDEEL